MYIANVDEDGFENNPHLDAVKEIAAAEDAVVVAICNKLESEIAELEDDERLEFLQELGMDEPGLDRVIRAGYELLDLQTYFTAGVKEVRAWTVKVGATAPEAAGVIHTDFQKGFIRAEVISYDDFIAQWRTGRQRRRTLAPGGQGLRGAGRRCHPFSLQRLSGCRKPRILTCPQNAENARLFGTAGPTLLMAT